MTLRFLRRRRWRDFTPSRSATLSLRSYTDPRGSWHEVVAAFVTRDEAEAFLDYLEKVGP